MIFYASRTSHVLQRRSWLGVYNVRFKSWNIVFFGSDNFSLVSLKELSKDSNTDVVKSLEVVTASSSTPVYKYSISKNIKVHLWPPDLGRCYDIGIVVSFGKLIPRSLIELFPLGIVNVHPSLLPRWRGAAPIVHAIKNGDTTTGITIQRIKPEAFDTGDIALKKLCQIGENELYPSLHNKLSDYGSQCLYQVISGLPESLDNCLPQEKKEVSYAKKFNKSISVVKWNEMTATEIYNLYRALFGIYDLKTMWQGVAVKLFCISLNKSDASFGSPGSIKYLRENNVLLVNCRDKPIRICSIFLNRKIYGAEAFNRGFLTQRQANGEPNHRFENLVISK